MRQSLLVNVVSRHGNGAGPYDNHAEDAKKSRLFVPSDGGGKTVEEAQVQVALAWAGEGEGPVP